MMGGQAGEAMKANCLFVVVATAGVGLLGSRTPPEVDPSFFPKQHFDGSKEEERWR
jgi:hypothetical protein